MSALPDFGQEPSTVDRGRYRFGPFILVPSSYTLTRAGVPVAIGARALGLLVHFVTHPGKVIDKAELIRAVWGNRLIEENNLTVQLSSLRRLLGDGVGGAQYIRTLAGRGYVFVSPVSCETATAAAEGGGAARTPRASVDPVPLLGRETELADLALRLTMSRVVLMTGIGGVGKSRLAREFVYGPGGQAFPGGASVLDLSGVGDEATAAAMIVAAIDAQRGAAMASPHRGSSQPGLLVLDASEKAARFLGRLVRGYLEDYPELSFLITSRETVPVSGGMSPVRLLPLSVPPDLADISAAEAMAFDSVRLLMAHAAVYLPRLTLANADAEAACRICRELDGLPLAIEMVAPHLQLLNLRQIAERIGDGLRAGAGGGEDRTLRHRTLRAVYDDSFARLSPAEARQIMELAVFAGGASLAGAVAVASTADEWLVLDALAGLNDKSLVDVDVTGATPRYTLLRGIRLLASEETDPAKTLSLRRHHAAYVADFFAQGAEDWPRMHSTRWSRLYGPDLPNLHTALAFAFGEGGCVALGRRLLATLYPLLIEGAAAELEPWLDLPEGRPDDTTPPALAARIWLAHALRAAAAIPMGPGGPGDEDGDAAILEMADRAAAFFRAAGDTSMLAAALSLIGPGAPGDAVRLGEAEMLLSDVPVSKWHIRMHVRRGALLALSGDFMAALAAYESALRVISWIGDPRSLARVTVERSEILFGLGRAEEAIAALETVEERLPDLWWSAVAPVYFNHLALTGQRPAALARLRSVLQASSADAVGRKSGETILLRETANALGLLAIDTNAVADAARWAGFAPVDRRGITAGMVWDRLERRLRDRLLPDSLAHFRAEGRAWTTSEAEAALTRLIAHVQDEA